MRPSYSPRSAEALVAEHPSRRLILRHGLIGLSALPLAALAACGGGGGGAPPVTVTPTPSPTPTPTTLPAISAAPTVTGIPYVGRSLSATQGTWTGAPTSYTYQWRRTHPLTGATSAIAGATASSYVLAAADKHHSIACDVTATNAAGSATAASKTTIRTLPARNSGATLVALGDSVTAGLNANATNTDIDPNFAWNKVYADAMGLVLTNRGVGSRTLSPATLTPNSNNIPYSIFTTGDAVGANKKDYVHVAAGGNDAFSGANYNNTTNFSTWSRRILNRLLTSGRYTRDDIGWGGFYPVSDAGLALRKISRTYWESFRAAEQAVVTEYGVVHMDWYVLTPVPSDLSSDNIHPTRSGHANLAAALVATQPTTTTVPKVLNVRDAVVGLSASGGAGAVTASASSYVGASGYVFALINTATYDLSNATLQRPTPSASWSGLAPGTYYVAVKAQFASGTDTPWAFSGATVTVT